VKLGLKPGAGLPERVHAECHTLSDTHVGGHGGCDCFCFDNELAYPPERNHSPEFARALCLEAIDGAEIWSSIRSRRSRVGSPVSGTGCRSRLLTVSDEYRALRRAAGIPTMGR
jgi:hypothetical protein